MTRVAAVDCGTNSLRLLIADIAADRAIELDRRMEVVRLGQGVDQHGVISAEALDRTLKMGRFYAALCREAGVERIRCVATSASRDAANQADFLTGMRAELGVEPEVITGAEEAELSFLGATRAVAAAHPGPFLVVDIGGGSTELVLGEAAGRDSPTEPAVIAARSVDVGCVRLTERHRLSDPPSQAEVLATAADIDAAIERAAAVVPLGKARTLIGVAGSVTTVTAHALGLDSYDPGLIHGAALPLDDVVAACDDLLTMTREQRAALPFMHPGRVDVIGAGALVWRRIVERVATDADLEAIVTSEHDILDGIAWRLGSADQPD